MTTQAAIHQAVEERRDEMLAFFKDFLAIETENPPGRNYPEGAQFLSEFMDDRGYDVTIVDVPNDVVETYYPDRTSYPRVNVIGDKGNGHGPNIHFTGHFDVVPAGKNWTRDPYNPIIEDGKVYGRGASDMKSGIVARLFALDALEDVINLNGTITQSMTVDEETGGFTGLGYLVKEGYLSPDNVDYCIYTECFDSSRICLGHRGVLKFRVTAYGEKAHGCMAHDGQNAIMAMHEFLSQIDTYQDELYTRTTDLPVTPDESNRADIQRTSFQINVRQRFIESLSPTNLLMWLDQRFMSLWKRRKTLLGHHLNMRKLCMPNRQAFLRPAPSPRRIQIIFLISMKRLIQSSHPDP
ncbi:MAG: M20/M25/M40 family metallo-hydrolase, partial [Halobacteriaceae archaeon]